MTTLSAEQVRWFRLRRSGLVEPFATPETAVSALVGIQAQILPAAAICAAPTSHWTRHFSHPVAYLCPIFLGVL